MDFTQLKSRYAQLRDEIDALAADAPGSQARRARLAFELDRIDRELAAMRRRVLFAPTLREVVPWVNPGQRQDGQERRARAR